VKLIADAPTLFVVEEPADEYYDEIEEAQQPTAVLRNGGDSAKLDDSNSKKT
jgi:PHD/YefM family antitoxin component YafN of YafNO toxin-antitoxin module